MSQGEGGGRPEIQLTEEQIVQVEALARYLPTDKIADYLGISRATFYNIMDRDEEVSRRYKRGRAAQEVSIARRLVEKADAGDTTAQIFYLKTQAGWREANRLEVTGADGGALKVSNEDMEDVRQILDAIAGKLSSGPEQG